MCPIGNGLIIPTRFSSLGLEYPLDIRFEVLECVGQSHQRRWGIIPKVGLGTEHRLNNPETECEIQEA